MFCKQCGLQIPDNAVICVHCGVGAGYSAGVVDPLAKSRTGYILLGVFLGALGIHNFYAGYSGKALTQLLVSVLLCWTFVAPAAMYIWAIVDVCTVTKDAQGRYFS